MKGTENRVKRTLYACMFILVLVACRPGKSLEPGAPDDQSAGLTTTESSAEYAPTREEQKRPTNDYGISQFLEQLMIDDAVATFAANQDSVPRLAAISLTYVGLGQWGNIDFTFHSAEGEDIAGPSAEDMWPREDFATVEGTVYDVGKGLQAWAETVVCYYVTPAVAGQRSPAYIPGIASGQELEAGLRWKWRCDTGGRFWQRNSCPNNYPIEDTD